MRIAIVVHNFLPIGGLPLQARGWAERLCANHLVTVVTPHGLADLAEPEDYALAGMPECRARHRVKAVMRRSLPESWRAFISKHLRARRAEGVRNRALMRAAEGIDPKPDLVLCFNTHTTGLAGVEVGRRLGIPAVVWIRGESDYGLQAFPRRRRVATYVWTRAAGVLVQTAKARADLLAELERVAPATVPDVARRLVVIGNGVELPELSPWQPDGPVLSAGRLVLEKGVDVVIEACAAADRPLVVAGQGPERAALEARAARLGADVRFTGLVGREELGELYRQASVVALASHHEGLPNVVLEAMAHGRPVVTTPVGGVPELIDDGVNGLLFPIGDAAALASALRRLAAEPETAARIAAAGRASVEQYSWDRVLPQLEAVLERWRTH